MRIDHARVAYLPGAVEAARGGFFSGGLANNREFAEGCVVFASAVAKEFQALMFDPQTSGGLLASIPYEICTSVLTALERQGIAAQGIGEVVTKKSPLIEIV